MARVTPAEYAEKHARRLTAAVPDIRKGIERVSEAPGVKAARSQDLMVTRLLEKINDGTWAAMVKSVSLEDWKRSAIDKGLNRIGPGISAAIPRQTVMAERLLAAVDSAASEVNAMPKGTIDDSIARVSAFMRKMKAAKIRR